MRGKVYFYTKLKQHQTKGAESGMQRGIEIVVSTHFQNVYNTGNQNLKFHLEKSKNQPSRLEKLVLRKSYFINMRLPIQNLPKQMLV